MFFWFCIVLCALAGCFVTTRDVMTGEPREVAVNGTRVVNAARFAVVEFNKANAEDVFAYKLSNISSAKIQVVAGINYILEVKISRTMCKTSVTTDGEPCIYHSEPKELQCHFIVTEVPWEDSRALTQNKCRLHNNCK
ncbi:cystatin-like [Larimichthys crocea]|uniref:cystatin-like n=1 Tax=Larimichthys crocea TaxID=215358 RepID=UPI00054BE3E4|nr:cystatin-like [Larimichthys crocea]